MVNSYLLKLEDDIEIAVSLKNVKHIYLRLDKNTAKAFVVAPKRVPNETIKKFLVSKIDWIKKHQAKIKSTVILPINEYQCNEIHYLFGEPYVLKIVVDNIKPIVFIENQNIVLQIKPDTSKEKKQMLVEKWYRTILDKEISSLINKWEPLMQVKVNEFGVKKMKTKWGTCNILAKRIWLNLELAKRPYNCLEYVVVHEMVHLLERNHTPKFHALMTRFLPNWKEIKVILNERRMY